jgi:hypothetical protein
VDYESGRIEILGFQPTKVGNGGVLSFTVIPKEQDIVPENNQLITILDSDISINMYDDASLLSGTVGRTRREVGLSE